ncbi:MAG TPA: SDR family NAD(P)-dependent oxidoreductase [Candidatus Acidoferrales bacterium]
MSAIYGFKVSNDEFQDKHVLVTGGTKGIGAALVRRFHLGGARVAGRIDILIHNVGGTETKRVGFELLTDEDWQNILNVNLLAAVRLDRAFLPGMIERASEVVIHAPIARGSLRPSRRKALGLTRFHPDSLKH